MRGFLIGGACALGLAGCAELNLTGNAAPVQRAALLGGAVDVAGPAGYCIDVADSRLARGFALLAPCGTLGLEDVDAPRNAGLITVQAGRAGTAAVAGSEPALAGFLESEAGAALLSDDDAGVTVLETTANQNKVTVHFGDLGGTPIAGTQDTARRAFVDIEGRLVTISVRGVLAAPLGASALEQLLDAAVNAMMAVNASKS